MVRLKNAQTGAVVNVSEETAARLGAPWTAEEKPKAEPKKSDKK